MALLNAAASDNGAGSTTLSVTVPSSTAGSCMLAFIGTHATDVSSVTDNLAQTYTRAFVPGANTEHSCVWTCKNSSAGVTSITATLCISRASVIFGVEESGINTTTPVDTSAFEAAPTSKATWTSTATSVTSQANTIGYGFTATATGSNVSFADTSGGTAVTGTGITAGHHGNTTDGNDMFVSRQVYASASAKTASGTNSTAITAGSIVVLRVAGGGGGVGGQQNRLLLGVG